MHTHTHTHKMRWCLRGKNGSIFHCLRFKQMHCPSVYFRFIQNSVFKILHLFGQKHQWTPVGFTYERHWVWYCWSEIQAPGNIFFSLVASFLSSRWPPIQVNFCMTIYLEMFHSWPTDCTCSQKIVTTVVSRTKGSANADKNVNHLVCFW